MEIRILQLLAGAREARGLTVVIDVFRAFSVACYAFGNGAASVLAVGDLDTAWELKRSSPNHVLIGERQGAAPSGFDFGNSPTEIEHVDFTGRTVIHTTSAGTQGLVQATHADEVITGAFVNAGAVVRHIQRTRPAIVSLVCMGREAVERADEDTLCANFLRDSLLGNQTDFAEIKTHLRHAQTAQKFFDPEIVRAPERDFDLCLSLDRFSFVLRAEKIAPEIARLKTIDPDDSGTARP